MHPDKGGGGVGYVLRKFPVLSETFILNEILAVEAQGVPVHIFALAQPRDPRFHENLSRLEGMITYVPGALEPKRLFRNNVRAAKAFGWPYYRTLLYVLTRLKPRLVWRFLQSGFIAVKARDLGLHHLHAHFATRPTTVAFLISKITGISYSFTGHAVDLFKSDVSEKILSEKIEQTQFAVTISDWNKTYLERFANGSKSKIVRIYNGIDLERFAPNGTPPRTPFQIITVARLVEKKGLFDLVEACGRLRDRDIAFECRIVGKGPLLKPLRRLIRERGLDDRVRLMGPHTQNEVLKCYHQSHLLVLPCLTAADGNRDGLPVSIVEALATGLPVVTTAVTGIPEVVRHSWNGLIVSERDPEALSDAIESLIRDERLYASLKENARASVQANFDARQSAVELRRLFEGERV